MKRLPKKLLRSRYRKTMWRKAKSVVRKLNKILPIKEAYVLGSFTTKKPRPADVDFTILLKIQDQTKDKWSVDLVIAPDNEYGREVLEDADGWVKEKYGLKNSTVIRVL
ncbi:MAG: hypothetical protein Q8R29_00465 [bacterium]|nr:hypothetical protein [bacterium]